MVSSRDSTGAPKSGEQKKRSLTLAGTSAPRAPDRVNAELQTESAPGEHERVPANPHGFNLKPKPTAPLHTAHSSNFS